ncbi:MAG TPA: SGNH/GDSL hydrolase family protein [Pilimelia sp.]|nr:SGNH/GDSL hydrolase family protein [Pilimelia sp.]
MREAADPGCLRAGEAAALLAGHPWRRFVALGDSVVEGLGDPVPGYVNLPWVDRVAAELRAVCPDLDYVNLGRRNLRAGQVRFEQLDTAVAYRPDLALVACGANDALHPGYRPEAVDAEVGAILSALRAAGADVLTVGLFDLGNCPAVQERFRPALARRMRTFARHTRALAELHGCVHIDLGRHPAVRDARLYSADGLHGNGRSHGISAAFGIRRIGSHLASTRAAGVRSETPP